MKHALSVMFFFALLVFCGCKKDSNTNDQTTEIVGNYKGSYHEFNGTFAFELEEIEAKITKASDTEINVSIKVVPGLVSLSFSATMTGKANFTVPTFTYDVDEFEGSGSLLGNVLSLKLNKIGEPKGFVSFEGTKQ